MRPQTYFRSLFLSISSTDYYTDVLQASLWFSFRFFLISIFVLGVLMAITFKTVEIPLVTTQLKQALNEAQTHFPSEVEIKWDGTQLTHTSPQPLEVRYPSFINSVELDLPSKLAYFLNQETTPEELDKVLPESSWIVTTPSHLYVNNLRGNWNGVPLTEVPTLEESFSLNRSNFPSWTEGVLSSWDQFVQAASYLLLPLIPFFLILSRLWLCAINSILGYFILRMNGVPLPYSKTFQMTLHIMVIAQIIEQVADLLYPTISFPLLSLSFWAYFAMIVFTQQRRLLQAWLKA